MSTKSNVNKTTMAMVTMYMLYYVIYAYRTTYR